MCPRCKRQNPQDAVYCENCGAELAPAGGAPAKRATKVEDVGSPAPVPSGGEFWRPAGGPAAVPKRSTMIESPAEPAPAAAAPAVNDPFRPRDPFAVSVGQSPVAPQPPVSPQPQPQQRKNATVYGSTPATGPTSDPFAVAVSPAVQAAPDRKLIGVLITFNDAPNGKVHLLREGKNTIGREDDRDIRLDDGRVSGKHACIQHRAGKTWVYDENSVNGTFLNGEDITTEKPTVTDGAVLRVGQTSFLVKLIDPAQQTALWGDGKAK